MRSLNTSCSTHYRAGRPLSAVMSPVEVQVFFLCRIIGSSQLLEKIAHFTPQLVGFLVTVFLALAGISQLCLQGCNLLVIDLMNPCQPLAAPDSRMIWLKDAPMSQKRIA